MAITQNDLEILKSEIMADTPDGGGLPTGIAVIDGVSNNLFPDVSDIDRLLGRVRLRKLYLAVKTASTDLLQATRMLITELPDNPNISVFFFKAPSFADRRVDAQNKIESYLAFGTRWAGHVLETQLSGQRVIQISLDKGDPLPSIDQPLVLVQNEGQSDEFYQYLRPLKIETVERRFQKNAQDTVTRIVATIEFGDTLNKSFVGLTVPEFYQNASTSRRAILREARIADAAKYYSASRLAEPVVAMLSRQVVIDSIFTQVVPSTMVETPLLRLDPVNQSESQSVSDGVIIINQSVNATSGTAFNLSGGVGVGTLSLTVGDIVLTDAKGELRTALGVSYGAINYSTGQITWYSNMNKGQVTVTGSYKPASNIIRVAQTDYQIVGGNAGYNFVRELGVTPLAGSLKVSYVVQGSVYTVTDDGRGNLVDVNGSGRGTITGKTVLLTTEAIPDAASHIIYSFAVDLDTYKYGATVLNKPYHALGVTRAVKGDVTITWGAKSAVLSGGDITGDASGKASSSQIMLAPNSTVAKGTSYTLAYDEYDEASVKTVTDTVQGGSVSLDLGQAFTSAKIDVIASTIDASKKRLKAELNIDSSTETVIVLNTYIEATEGVWSRLTGVGSDYLASIKSVSVSKSTGLVSFIIAFSYYFDIHGGFYASIGSDYVPYEYQSTNTYPIETSVSTMTAVIGTASTAQTSSGIFGDMRIDLAQDNAARVITNSVYLTALGKTLNDKSGSVYNGATKVGVIDYSAGVITLNEWQTGVTNSANLISMMREQNPLSVGNIIFRTPNAPLKEASLQIDAILEDGTAISLTTNTLGNITGSKYAHGTVDFKAGVVMLYFYEKLGVIANPTVVDEPWYDVSNVYSDGGLDYINKPIYVKPDSIRYNAIAYSYLPLDKELIGLDPVRLPTDGRVPFVRKGDSVAITELKTMVLPTNAPNDLFDLGFERLSDVNVVDSTGKKVSFDYLDIDLDAGTLQLNGLFDMSFYTAPLTAKYRIMDIALVIETDISGRVTLSTPITHDYSTAAVFSSMLLAGDMQARAFNVFGQQSWGSVFSDTLIGNATTSQLQVTNNPIVITNRDAIEERWALVFTSATAFNIIGQTVGQIGTGTTSTLTAPINPMTGYAYFTIPAAAWGTGWSANNVVRINTAAAKYPVWIGNAIQQHQGSSSDNYDFTIGYHANIDRERGDV
ncbi:hypothetical protein [Psychrobacter glacincola]|uniref:hypothetical protein n=1 Tax=Psychrobacter glacincola TaxID=56810 RepID=UPI0039B021B5